MWIAGRGSNTAPPWSAINIQAQLQQKQPLNERLRWMAASWRSVEGRPCWRLAAAALCEARWYYAEAEENTDLCLAQIAVIRFFVKR